MTSFIEVKRICQYCGKEFTARKTTTRTCSDRCANLYYKSRKRAAKIEASNKETIALKTPDLEYIKQLEFLSVKNAACLLNTTPRTIYRMISAGTINAVNLARRKTLICKQDIEFLFKKTENIEVDNAQEIPDDDDKSNIMSLDAWIRSGGDNISACYTLTDIQNKFGISEKAVHDLIKRNKIPRVKLGWYTYASKATIDKLLNKE